MVKHLDGKELLTVTETKELLADVVLLNQVCKNRSHDPFLTNSQGKEKKFLTTCTKLGVHIKPDGLYAKGS